MFDNDQLLADLAALDPVDAYRAAASLHWRIRDLGAAKGVQLVQSLLPGIERLRADITHEYDDAGGTYRVFNGVTLSLRDGRTLELPDESQLGEDEWADMLGRRSLDAAAEQRVDALTEENPDLNLTDAVLAELGSGFGLDSDAMLLLIDVTSYLVREREGESVLTFGPVAGSETAKPVDQAQG